MPISIEAKTRLLETTRGAAAAFLEDMEYMRDLTNRGIRDRRELRHLSAILRRLLIDGNGDLRSIAPPRTGRLHFLAPDNSPFYPIDRKMPFLGFFSGGPKIFGLEYRALVMHTFEVKPLGYDPDRTVVLNQDGFLSQKVLSIQGKWATRGDAIKYSANIASGVHSNAPSTEVELTLERIGRLITFDPVDIGDPANTAMKIGFDYEQFSGSGGKFKHRPKTFDAVLLEMFAAAHYIVSSPEVMQLEVSILAELEEFEH